MWDGIKGINITNSSLAVQCTCKDVCSSRHTQLCENCQYNKGRKEEKNCYKPIK